MSTTAPLPHSPVPEAGRPTTYVGWLIAERLLRACVSAIALSVVARHLAPAGFGALNLALTLVGLAMPLAQLGLEVVVVRELVRAPDRAGELLGTSAILRLIAGAGCALLVFGLGHSISAFASARVAIGPVCLMLIVQALEAPDLWFRSQVQARPTAIARTAAVVAGAAGKIALALAGAGIAAFAWLALAELILFQVGLALFYRGDFARARWHWNGKLAHHLARESGIFALAATLGGIAFRVDQLGVAVLLNDTEAGLYFSALRLIEIPTFIAASVAAALLPALARDEHAIADGRYETALALMAAIAWLTAIATTIAGPAAMNLFLGSAYAPANSALIVRAWALLPFFSLMVRAHIIAATRSPGTQVGSVLFSFGAQLALSLALIPRFGLTGAASAFFASEMLVAWVFPLAVSSLRPTIRAQARAWFSCWLPSTWPRLYGLLRGENTPVPPVPGQSLP